jgi:hypothetical protein
MLPAESYPLDGGCDCQTIRYRMHTRPLFVHCCHCRWCQQDVHLFTASRQPWITLAQGTPAVPGYYDRTKYLPTESLARWAR